MHELIVLLETYKYAILFPLAIIEGPLLAILAGFLVSIGYLNIYATFALVVFGDIIGDTLQYGLGRFGSGLLHRQGHRIGISPEKLESAKTYFKEHHVRSVALSKLVHGIGFIGLIAAGSMRVRYRSFMLTAFVISLGQSAALLALGLFFGYAYAELAHYLNVFAASISLFAVFVFIVLIVRMIIKTRTTPHA